MYDNSLSKIVCAGGDAMRSFRLAAILLSGVIYALISMAQPRMKVANTLTKKTLAVAFIPVALVYFIFFHPIYLDIDIGFNWIWPFIQWN